MTAEIAILNKSAVALAADSAVTIGRGTEEYKVYQSANKLFALSKYHPVGLMVYGQAMFMGVDWETIIKVYRNQLGKRTFESLHEHANHFLSFLQDNSDFSDQDSQDAFIKLRIRAEFSSILQEVLERLRNEIARKGEITESDIRLTIKTIVSERHALLRSFEQVQTITGESLPNSKVEDLRTAYRPFVDRIKKEVFKNLPLESVVSRRLNEISVYVFTRQAFHRATAGVVVAGYGAQDVFPSVMEFRVEGVFHDTLKFSRERTSAVGSDVTSAIIPFAQSEMVHSFMEGVDPAYQEFIERAVRAVLDEYGSTLLDLIKQPTAATKSLHQAISKVNEDVWNGLDEAMTNYRNARFVDPVVDTVENLPKSELAAMAESLVNLTSFRQRVTPDTETVGGPIDVAVISRGDGFVWIKRKHYFDPELNHHFFANYYREDTNGKQQEGRRSKVSVDRGRKE